MYSVSVWRGKGDGAFVRYQVPRQTSQPVLDVVSHIQRHLDTSLAYLFACRVRGGAGGLALSREPVLLPRVAPGHSLLDTAPA